MEAALNPFRSLWVHGLFGFFDRSRRDHRISGDHGSRLFLRLLDRAAIQFNENIPQVARLCILDSIDVVLLARLLGSRLVQLVNPSFDFLKRFRIWADGQYGIEALDRNESN